MFQVRHIARLALRVSMTRHEQLVDVSEAGAVFIGLGDEFDDDRRLVRELTLVRHPAARRGLATLFAATDADRRPSRT
jgi:hypothetical protein